MTTVIKNGKIIADDEILVGKSLYFEDGRITALEPGAAVTCSGDSGLGEIDPADYWEKQDDLAARAILDRITA